MAETLLRKKKETSVCVFEKEDRFGGRIFDYRFPQAPDISVGKVPLKYEVIKRMSERACVRAKGRTSARACEWVSEQTTSTNCRPTDRPNE